MWNITKNFAHEVNEDSLEFYSKYGDFRLSL